VSNFLLDDQKWTIRYLVADTGGFFKGRRLLISPISFREIDWPAHRMHLALTKEKVEKSPGIDTDKPVSRQHEEDYYQYYGYPQYWGYSGLWGTGSYPGSLASGRWNESPGPRTEPPGDPHLRSAMELRGYKVQATDTAVGHVADFIVDDETWQVRYLVIDTSTWWFGKKVLVPPHWATRITWEIHEINIDLSREAIKNSPEWSANTVPDRDYEARLHAHYGRAPYWDRSPGSPGSSAEAIRRVL
jgi:hypothetical protein